MSCYIITCGEDFRLKACEACIEADPPITLRLPPSDLGTKLNRARLSWSIPEAQWIGAHHQFWSELEYAWTVYNAVPFDSDLMTPDSTNLYPRDKFDVLIGLCRDALRAEHCIPIESYARLGPRVFNQFKVPSANVILTWLSEDSLIIRASIARELESGGFVIRTVPVIHKRLGRLFEWCEVVPKWYATISEIDSVDAPVIGKTPEHWGQIVNHAGMIEMSRLAIEPLIFEQCF